MRTGPPVNSEAEGRRARLLVTTRRRATGLLLGVTVAFALSTAFAGSGRWVSWVQATAAASMVGGLADWFAVTALFRRPLGLPVPHTAIVVERKDRFAETLGAFVQESFLSPEAVRARLRAAGAVPRLAAALADRDHARKLAEGAAEVLARSVSALRDADVSEALESIVRQRLEQAGLAPAAGRLLEQVTRDGRHEPVIDAGLRALSSYVRERGPDLHRRLGVQSPWWLPGSVSNRMVSGLLTRTESVLHEMAADRSHPLRMHLATGLAELAVRLQRDPALAARAEELKRELLAQSTVRQLASTVWNDVKDQLRKQAAVPDSDLRRRLAVAIADTGRRLQEDPELADRVEQLGDRAVTAVLTSFDDELVALVTGTINRWDGAETSRRLELLLGPDLQYIRINGTVVGALAGLALHAVSVLAG